MISRNFILQNVNLITKSVQYMHFEDLYFESLQVK